MMFDSTLILIATVFALAGFVTGVIGNTGRDGLRDIGAFAFFDLEAHMGVFADWDVEESRRRNTAGEF